MAAKTGTIVIDATELVVGRLAAFCAKKAITGHDIEITNIEKAVISGNSLQVVNVFRKRRTMTNPTNPEKASKWPVRPDLLFKKILSGMVPHGGRGKEALARVKAYIGTSGKAKGIKPVRDSSSLKHSFTTLGKLCSELGWRSAAGQKV